MSRLDEIIAYKREELRELKNRQPLARLERTLKNRLPKRPFRDSIGRPGSLSLIAEIKRASPSAGVIHLNVQPPEVAWGYRNAGAQAISVLTDEKFFQGSLSDLTAVKQKVDLPVLRKDFLLEEYSVVETAAAGADAVLLIAALLKAPILKRLLHLAREVGLEALVEVHTEGEVAEVLQAEGDLLGINNRDLHTFQVDLKTTERLIGGIPPGRVVVSESGLKSREDVQYVEAQGVAAVLIGEELMQAPDPGRRIQELMGW